MAHPDKHVTILHAARLPISDAFPDYFREKTVASLKEHGVEILLNEKVDTDSLGTSGKIKLKSGKVLSADLIVTPFRFKRFLIIIVIGLWCETSWRHYSNTFTSPL
jgi:hypothetical protein